MAAVGSAQDSTQIVTGLAQAPPPMRFLFATDAILGSRETQEDSRGLLVLNGEGGTEQHVPAPDSPGLSGEARCLVAVVADGVGGEEAGEVASALACRTFLDETKKRDVGWAERLNGGLEKANEAICAEIEAHPDRQGMATTLVGVVFKPEGLGWVSIGDSLLYRWRAGALERLNADHSVRGLQLVRAERGEITFEEARSYPGNVLVYVLNGQPLGHFEHFEGFRRHEDGDVILVCSDGVKTLPEDEIARIVEAHRTAPAKLVEALLDAVEKAAGLKAERLNRRKRQDNTSIIAVHVSSAEAQSATAGPSAMDTVATPADQSIVATAPIPDRAADRPISDATIAALGPGTRRRSPTGFALGLLALFLAASLAAYAFFSWPIGQPARPDPPSAAKPAEPTAAATAPPPIAEPSAPSLAPEPAQPTRAEPPPAEAEPRGAGPPPGAVAPEETQTPVAPAVPPAAVPASPASPSGEQPLPGSGIRPASPRHPPGEGRPPRPPPGPDQRSERRRASPSSEATLAPPVQAPLTPAPAPRPAQSAPPAVAR